MTRSYNVCVVGAGRWGKNHIRTLSELGALGEYSFIGSGAIVTKDVPDHALVVGNPGKSIGWVNKKGHRLKFDENGISLCGNYKLTDGIIKRC